MKQYHNDIYSDINEYNDSDENENEFSDNEINKNENEMFSQIINNIRNTCKQIRRYELN